MKAKYFLSCFFLFSILSLHSKAGNSSAEKKSIVNNSHNTIEFDEKVVEGMGTKDLNTARHTGEEKGRKRERLVREKTDFHDEMKRALREVPWVQ